MKVHIGKLKVPKGMLEDGAVDRTGVMIGGMPMVTLSADEGRDARKPNAVLLECDCGWVRRVVLDNEVNVYCGNPAGCDNIWKLKREMDGYRQDGKVVWKVERDGEGKPVFEKMSKKEEWRKEGEKRAMKGEGMHVQPQGPVSQEKAEEASKGVVVKRGDDRGAKYFEVGKK